MKSALFESINDRSNIANAYMKMIGESVDEDYLSHAFEGIRYPLTIIDDNGDDVVEDLYSIMQEYKDPQYYEKGYDDYYIALAFDQLKDDELYKKLIEEEPEYHLSEPAILRAGCTYDKNDVLNSIAQIGRELEKDFHKDDVEVMIPEWAAVYYENDDDSGLTEEDKKLADDYLNKITSQGYYLAYDGENMGFCPHPEFGLASDCVKYYLIKNGETFNESVSTDGGAWFDSTGTLVKDIPEECIKQCTQPGHDAYEDCKYWVKELGFADGLDIPLAKGYLKWTGGWEPDEIASFSPEETAIRLLWIVCGDLKEGMDLITIGDGGRFGEDYVGESVDRKTVRVILTAIDWPENSDTSGASLPQRDSMTIEVGTNEDINNIINGIYIDSFGVAPRSFRIAKKVDLGGSSKKKNEMVSQQELDKLKKKNPKLKDVSETR